jgi:N-glycosylase/DNA lyase
MSNDETNPNDEIRKPAQTLRQGTISYSCFDIPSSLDIRHSSLSSTHVIKILAHDFDLQITLDSGQVFHWQKVGDGFIGAIADLPIYVEQRAGTLRVLVEGGAPATPSERHAEGLGSQELAPPVRKLVEHYFALDHPLADICDSFPDDPVMNAARDFCQGLRIIRQPKWECLAMFICSSMKQVAHIRQISLALRKRFGQQRRIADHVVYTFPLAQRLAQASERDLRECKLGYRAKNLRATARLVSSGQADLEAWSALSDAELRKQLCALPGVGPKIANCVMLFAFERLRAFPIDVWIDRVLRQQYFPRRNKMTAQMVRQFTERYFGEHGGYAQQYLFHHARTGRHGDRAIEVNRRYHARNR